VRDNPCLFTKEYLPAHPRHDDGEKPQVHPLETPEEINDGHHLREKKSGICLDLVHQVPVKIGTDISDGKVVKSHETKRSHGIVRKIDTTVKRIDIQSQVKAITTDGHPVRTGQIAVLVAEIELGRHLTHLPFAGQDRRLRVAIVLLPLGLLAKPILIVLPLRTAGTDETRGPPTNLGSLRDHQYLAIHSTKVTATEDTAGTIPTTVCSNLDHLGTTTMTGMTTDGIPITTERNLPNSKEVGIMTGHNGKQLTNTTCIPNS
jgi:hypothetical protein